MKICFINWWSNGVNDFFYFFIKKYINKSVELCNVNPDIIFCSVFGSRRKLIKYLKKKKNSISIFFTGESTSHPSHTRYDDHLLDIVDISLGFKFITHKNYIRFPLWMTYINLDSNMGKNSLNFNKLNTMNNVKNKKKFCCILNNHDNFKTRTNIFNKINKYKKVDSGGRWNKNINYTIKDGVDTKHKWLLDYKFNICCESLIEKGYITEKIFECLLAGCIPIYFVNNKNDLIENNILNQNIILKFTNENIDEILEKIKLLDSNYDEYIKFTNQPIIKDNSLNEIHKIYNKLQCLINTKLY